MTGPAGSLAVDQRRAWAWVGHLRAGGITPWADWTGTGAPTSPGDQTHGYLPGAQQLELLRRLNLAAGGRAGTNQTVRRDLANRVLDASAPGRGRPDLELVGTREPSRFGPRPIDPAKLPDEELVRLAISVLADELVADEMAAGAQAASVHRFRVPRRGRWLNKLARRPYRLVGDPVLADPLRAQLIARGRPPGGPRAQVLVLGDGVETMLADAFEARALDAGGPSWAEWIAVLAARDHLAPRVDLARIACYWAGRTSPERVTIVLDPALVPGLVGVRRLSPPKRLSAEAVDLSRRIAAVLGLLVGPARRPELLERQLAPRLTAQSAGRSGATYVVPDEHADWLAEQQERQIRQLRRRGYQVVGGDLGQLSARSRAGGSARVVEIGDTSVLNLAMDLLLDNTDGSRG